MGKRMMGSFFSPIPQQISSLQEVKHVYNLMYVRKHLLSLF